MQQGWRWVEPGGSGAGVWRPPAGERLRGSAPHPMPGSLLPPSAVLLAEPPSPKGQVSFPELLYHLADEAPGAEFKFRGKWEPCVYKQSSLLLP